MPVEVDVHTQVLAVLGNPVRHSLSPAIHNTAIQALGLNYVYVAFEVEDITDAIAGMRGLGIRGYSITIPHKVAAMGLADEVDPVAASIGSINTLVNNEGVLRGYNTDGYGALRAIESIGVNLEGGEVTILGSGGAARAIAFTLAVRSELSKINILGVLEDEVKALRRHVAQVTSAKVESDALNPDNLKRYLANSQLLINCTPIGMHPRVDETLVPVELLGSPMVVFDVVYNPRETRLLREARTKRCRVISGVEMFIHQAVAQFELFTGQNAPVAAMRKVVLDSLKG
jgi:shikimate dehydrogenase